MECGLNGSSLRCVLVYEACFKFYSCNEDIKPSAAFSCRHVKYKIHAAECTKFLTRHFYFKNSKIFWGGAQPLPDPSPAAAPTPSAPAAPRIRAFGAHSRTPHSEVWLRACITRGHSLKLVNNRYHYDLRKFPFTPRIVNVWNSLPEIVISADTTNTFKRRLDKFWQHQDILYDYKVELTGVGNRSQINADDNIVI